MKRMRRLMVSLLAAAEATGAVADDHAESSPSFRLAVLLRMDPGADAGLAELAREAEALIPFAKAQQEQIKEERKRIWRTTGLNNLPVPGLEQYFHDPPGTLDKRDARGLAEIVRLSRAARETQLQREREDLLSELR